jgi:hypothetical protein
MGEMESSPTRFVIFGVSCEAEQRTLDDGAATLATGQSLQPVIMFWAIAI